jgi:hypothetical protein
MPASLPTYTPLQAGTGQTVIANSTVWGAWNQVYASSGTTTMTIPVITTAGTGSNGAVWANWNATCTAGTTTVSTLSTAVWTQWNTGWEETRETRERREAQERAALAAAGERAAAARAARAAANTRAEELLLSLLTPEQAATYRERGWFEVRGSKGGRWRIRNRGQSGNVDLMPRNRG